MGSIQESLSIFELTSLPDLATLQKHYTRLLKLYHPDLNLERPHWAHEKTRELIDAFGTLKELIHNRETFRDDPTAEKQNRDFWSTWWREATGGPAAPYGESVYEHEDYVIYEDEPPAQGTSFSPSSDGSFTMQLIRSGRNHYAIPLSWIIRVLSYRDSLVKRIMGEYFCLYENESFPVDTLDGETLPFKETEYILLYDSGTSRRAFLLPTLLNFDGMDSVSPGEIIRKRTENLVGGIIQVHSRLYRIPSSVFVEMQNEPSFSHAAL